MSIEMYALTSAEVKAIEATKYGKLSVLNINNIRTVVSECLRLIGRNGVFDEYTLHDYSHVNNMLTMLDWIIPKETKEKMTSYEFALLVLSIYLHDLGMVVTKSEYEKRNITNYRSIIEFDGAAKEEFIRQFDGMSSEIVEAFLYQEFVRKNHALRIKHLIMHHTLPSELGIAEELSNLLKGLFDNLDEQIKIDLALICESHHCSDLDNIDKYKIGRAYGQSSNEIVNMQYIACVLRTVDLLDITEKRTPSVLYQLIDPQNPFSQVEWAKQSAIRRISPKPLFDKDGVNIGMDDSDTIEIHAYFTSADGFFALDKYIIYAENELKTTSAWIAATNRKKLSDYKFVWKKIDSTNIETRGFIKKNYVFTIDHAEILELLTGHTLYNDSSVVLRELIQNSIDAIRFRECIEKVKNTGKISIEYTSEDGYLTVTDNGTGMTQDIIENYLLNVGASYYKSADVNKNHPEFCAISRFGIGILSTFMIADNVEITTVHKDDVEGRRLTLKSVHGNYLIKLLDKNSKECENIHPSGTIIKIKIRKDARIDDFIKIARKWVVVPGCEIQARINSGAWHRVGFKSCKDAVVSIISTMFTKSDISIIDGKDDIYKLKDTSSKRCITVEQKTFGTSTLAYALTWNDYFKTWEFLKYGESRLQSRIDAAHLIGTCVGGIKVTNESPGFEESSIIAIADISGKNAPKTNVARTDVERNMDFVKHLENVYKMYIDHASEELDSLINRRKKSIGYAAREVTYLLSPLFDEKLKVVEPALIDNSLAKIKMVMIEEGEKREAICPNDLYKKESFWTLHGNVYDRAEEFLSEASIQLSRIQLLEYLGRKINLEEKKCIACFQDTNRLQTRISLANHDVAFVRNSENDGTLELKWKMKSDKIKWVNVKQKYYDTFYSGIEDIRKPKPQFEDMRRYYSLNFNIPFGTVTRESSESNYGFEIFGKAYLMPNTLVSSYITQKLKEIDLDPENDSMRIAKLLSIGLLYSNLGGYAIKKDVIKIKSYIENLVKQHDSTMRTYGFSNYLTEGSIDIKEISDLIVSANWTFFNYKRYMRFYKE